MMMMMKNAAFAALALDSRKIQAVATAAWRRGAPAEHASGDFKRTEKLCRLRAAVDRLYGAKMHLELCNVEAAKEQNESVSLELAQVLELEEACGVLLQVKICFHQIGQAC